MLWAALYYFLLLAAYFVIRPIRDEMGVAGGVRNLSWLFLGTLVGMLLIHPLFTALVSRLPRRLFIPSPTPSSRSIWSSSGYAFESFRGTSGIWAGRVFFIWTSVFNLFVVSIFWSLMSDLFRPEQAKRLFGFVAIGGTIGAVVGSSVTAFLCRPNHPEQSPAGLGGAARAGHGGSSPVDADRAPVAKKDRRTLPSNSEVDRPVGGGILDGSERRFVLAIPARHRRLHAALHRHSNVPLLPAGGDRRGQLQRTSGTNGVFCASGSGRQFTDGHHPDFPHRAHCPPHRDRAVPRRPPAGLRFRFCRGGHRPDPDDHRGRSGLARSSNYAIARPCREMLYTVLPRDAKYKAKNFIDTFVYRFGDQVGAWSYTGSGRIGSRRRRHLSGRRAARRSLAGYRTVARAPSDAHWSRSASSANDSGLRVDGAGKAGRPAGPT